MVARVLEREQTREIGFSKVVVPVELRAMLLDAVRSDDLKIPDVDAIEPLVCRANVLVRYCAAFMIQVLKAIGCPHLRIE